MKALISNIRIVLTAAACISVLFSVWSIIAHPLLNNDAFGYLRAAELLESGNIQQVIEQYGWYGYSIIIALADRILPTGLLGSAYILNTLSYILLVMAFIRLCRQLHDGPLIPFLAALTVLCFPLINEMRFMLIRDFAFWGFAILGLHQLVRFNITGNMTTAFGWCAAMFAAIFFRLEGLILLLAPLCYLTPRTCKKGIKLGAALLVGLAIIWLASLLLQINLLGIIRFAYRYYLPLIFDMGTLLNDTTRETLNALYVPGNFPDTDNTTHGLVIVLFAYCWTVLANLVNALGMPITVFIAWGMARYGFQALPCGRRALLAYLVLTTATLLIFVTVMQFLTQRYATLLCLLLLTQVPAFLQKMADQAMQIGRHRRLMAAAASIFFYLLADSLVSFGYSTRYIRESITWMQDNIPQGSRLRTNNFAIAHGTGLIEEYDRISRNPELVLQNLVPGDYIALDLHHDQLQWSDQLAQDDSIELITTFSNTRDDRIVVYRHH